MTVEGCLILSVLYCQSSYDEKYVIDDLDKTPTYHKINTKQKENEWFDM